MQAIAATTTGKIRMPRICMHSSFQRTFGPLWYAGERTQKRKISDPEPGTVLASVGVPDGTGRIEVQALPPHHVGLAAAVNRHAEIIAEGKAESGGLDIAVAVHCARELGDRGPGCAAVGRAAVIGIPQWMVACIHPADAHIARRPRRQRGKGMLGAIRSR